MHNGHCQTDRQSEWQPSLSIQHKKLKLLWNTKLL